MCNDVDEVKTFSVKNKKFGEQCRLALLPSNTYKTQK